MNKIDKKIVLSHPDIIPVARELALLSAEKIREIIPKVKPLDVPGDEGMFVRDLRRFAAGERAVASVHGRQRIVADAFMHLERDVALDLRSVLFDAFVVGAMSVPAEDVEEYEYDPYSYINKYLAEEKPLRGVTINPRGTAEVLNNLIHSGEAKLVLEEDEEVEVEDLSPKPRGIFFIVTLSPWLKVGMCDFLDYKMEASLNSFLVRMFLDRTARNIVRKKEVKKVNND